MIKGILFDLDDTLYDYRMLNKIALERLSEYSCEKFHITKEQFDKAFSKGREETKKGIETLAAAHNRMIYMQKTLEYLHINPFSHALEMYDIYWNYILENMNLFDGVEDVLQDLKRMGIKIGICTDLTTQIQHRKIRKLGLESYIDTIVTSEEAGVEKPDRKMFQISMNKLQLHASKILYIGDSYERDMIGARNCGMKTYWYNPEKTQREDLSMVDEEFADYATLRRMLENEFEKY